MPLNQVKKRYKYKVKSENISLDSQGSELCPDKTRKKTRT